MSKRIKPVELKTNLGTFVLHNGHVFQEKNHQEKNHGQRDLYICCHFSDEFVIKLFSEERRIRDMTIVVDAEWFPFAYFTNLNKCGICGWRTITDVVPSSVMCCMLSFLQHVDHALSADNFSWEKYCSIHHDYFGVQPYNHKERPVGGVLIYQRCVSKMCIQVCIQIVGQNPRCVNFLRETWHDAITIVIIFVFLLGLF